MGTWPLDVDDLLSVLEDPATEQFDGLPDGTTVGHVHLCVAQIPETVAFYRDALGLPVLESWENEGGSGAILGAGRATLELLSPGQTAYVDEIEVGRPASGPVRLALEVKDSDATAGMLEEAGAERLGGPVVTPASVRDGSMPSTVAHSGSVFGVTSVQCAPSSRLTCTRPSSLPTQITPRCAGDSATEKIVP